MSHQVRLAIWCRMPVLFCPEEASGTNMSKNEICSKSILISKTQHVMASWTECTLFQHMVKTKRCAATFGAGCTDCQLEISVLGPFREKTVLASWTIFGSHMAKCGNIYSPYRIYIYIYMNIRSPSKSYQTLETPIKP